MRQIGTLPDEKPARTFADYLLTLNISTDLKPAADGWAVWVHKEDLVSKAKGELAHFQENPDDPRYRQSISEAEAIRRKEEELDRQHARNIVDLRGKLGRGPMLATGPLTRTLISITVVVFLLQRMNVELFGRTIEGWFLFTNYRPVPGLGLRTDGLRPILQGQIWRLLTPMFLHSGILHILFNMYMLFQLGRAIEARKRLSEYALLIVLTSIAANLAQFYLPDLFTVPGERTGGGPFGGMSGVVYGLFGYIWVKSRFDPGSGLYLHPNTVMLLLFWLILCAFNILGPIANTAHVVGMLAGMAVAGVPIWRERMRV
jgi:GlpG protein